jgi:uncharacterized membrane protein (DUF2068 family)
VSQESPEATNGRPFGVTVIAAAMVTNAVIAAVRTYIGQSTLAWDDVLRSSFYFELAGPFVGGVGLIVSIGLWLLRRWAWYATMLWAGVNMAQALYAYWVGEPQFISMALSVLIVLYMNQRDVQLAFIERSRGGSDAD